MTFSVKHSFTSAEADGVDATLIQPSNWNAEHTLTAAAGKVLGRDTSGAGVVQELPIAVTSSGDVGLGTSSPNAKVDVQTTGAYSAYFQTAVDQASNVAARRISLTAINFRAAVQGQSLSGTWGADDLLINPSGGNVGIGTSSPSQKLSVIGDVIATNNTNGALLGSSEGSLELFRSDSTSYIDFKTSTSEDYDCRIQQASNGLTFATGGNGTAAERLRIDSAGNVGIGATLPGATGFTSFLALGNNNAGIGNLGANIVGFATNNLERMRIDSAGRVGIGTASPVGLLDVSGGDIYLRNTVFIGSSGNVASDATYLYLRGGGFAFQNAAATATYFQLNATNYTINSQPTYDNTAAGSTVVVTSTGQIRRTSSSIKYKKDVESLDPALATNAINNLRPVWYRTKNPEGDDKATWSHIGLIAEEVHEVEPRLVRYRTAEVIDEQKPVLDEAGDPVLDEEGNPTFTTERVERELAVPEPEDVDYARLSVLLLAKVKELETRLAALEAA